MSQFTTGLSGPLSFPLKATDIVPSRGIHLFSDFNGDWSPFTICTGTASSVGSSSFVLSSTMTDKAIGELVMSLAPYSTAGTRIGVYANTVPGTSSVNTSLVDRYLKINDMNYNFEARVVVPTMPGQYQRLGVGFFNSHAPPSTTSFVQNGAAFVSTQAGNWKCVVASADVQVETATSYTATTYRKLRITTNATSNVIQFFIDNTLVHSTTATWDTANSLLSWCAEARDKTSVAGGSSGVFKVDYMMLTGDLIR